MAIQKVGCYTLALCNGTTNGGLVQAYKTDDAGDGTIKPDGQSPEDPSCQFHVYKRFDTSTSDDQDVFCFESAKFKQYLYWSVNTKVCLKQCSCTTDADLANNKCIWWVVDGFTDSTLLKPFKFPDGTPYALAFEDKSKTESTDSPSASGNDLNDVTPDLTPSLSYAEKNGLFYINKLTE